MFGIPDLCFMTKLEIHISLRLKCKSHLKPQFKVQFRQSQINLRNAYFLWAISLKTLLLQSMQL